MHKKKKQNVNTFFTEKQWFRFKTIVSAKGKRIGPYVQELINKDIEENWESVKNSID